jgi:hypothetical protein
MTLLWTWLGRPSPTPLTEYVDCGDYIVHEVIPDSGSGRTRYRTIIPKDTEEYRKFVSFGAPKSV